MNRFDYVKYDELAQRDQDVFKTRFVELAEVVEVALMDGRAKSLVLTKLEEAYMWVGKAIRDRQIARSGGIAPLQEERKNG
jgi:hypothetical protein